MLFGKYFAGIGDRLASSIPNVIKAPLEYLNTINPDSFFIFPVTATEIELKSQALKLVRPVDHPAYQLQHWRL